jgi:hypothetical protein
MANAFGGIASSIQHFLTRLFSSENQILSRFHMLHAEFDNIDVCIRSPYLSGVPIAD